MAPATTQDLSAVAPIKGPQVWNGQDFAKSDNFSVLLDGKDVEEIEAAVKEIKAQAIHLELVNKNNFKLSADLAERLQQCAKQIHAGSGFNLVKGLDLGKYSAEESTIVFLGISSYIADQKGMQDRKGNMLSHITSSKKWTVPVEKRHGIHSSSSLPFHNDMGCDILALQCRDAANKGGATYLSSAAQVFNHLLVKEPEVLQTLMSPTWPVQVSGTESKFYLAPAVTINKDNLMISMDPNRFGPHPASNDTQTPALSEAQTHALERVSAVARESELALNLEAGDMLFFNNWALLHRRDGYNDGEQTTRHLVRLWLRNNELGWNVPQQMSIPWEAAYGRNTSWVEKQYKLEPMATYEIPTYTAGSAAFVLED